MFRQGLRILGILGLWSSFLTAQNDSRGLKDYFAGYFFVGASIAPQETEGAVAQLILKEFNTIFMAFSAVMVLNYFKISCATAPSVS